MGVNKGAGLRLIVKALGYQGLFSSSWIAVSGKCLTRASTTLVRQLCFSENCMSCKMVCAACDHAILEVACVI